MKDEVKVVIGSWGSYNECNERALGSQWLTLSDYNSWEEIEEELKKEGFELDGIDEELFIQDIEGLPADIDWDYMSPQRLFEILDEAEILTSSYKAELLDAFLQVECWSDFEHRVDSSGSRWDDDIYLYSGYDWADLGREMLGELGIELNEYIEPYFDYEAYGESFEYDGYYRYDDGILCICG